MTLNCQVCTAPAAQAVTVIYGAGDETCDTNVYLCQDHAKDDPGVYTVQEVIWADEWEAMAKNYADVTWAPTSDIIEIAVAEINL